MTGCRQRPVRRLPRAAMTTLTRRPPRP